MSLPTKQLSITAEELNDAAEDALSGVAVVNNAHTNAEIKTVMSIFDTMLYQDGATGTLKRTSLEAINEAGAGNQLLYNAAGYSQIVSSNLAAGSPVNTIPRPTSVAGVIKNTASPPNGAGMVVFMYPAGLPIGADIDKAELRFFVTGDDTDERLWVADSRAAINHLPLPLPVNIAAPSDDRPTNWPAATSATVNVDTGTLPLETGPDRKPLTIDVTSIVAEATAFTSGGDSWAEDGNRTLAIRFRVRTGDTTGAFTAGYIYNSRLVITPV